MPADRKRTAPKKDRADTFMRAFCFTLNNYTEEEYAATTAWLTERAKYAIVGKEVGESGTPHLQGYATLKNNTRFTVIRRALPRAHIEKRRGSPRQAADYCRKEDKQPFEVGTPPKQGRRTDLLQLVEDARNPELSNADLFDRHPVPMLKFRKHVMNMRADYARRENAFSPVEVLVFWGDAGTGKTRKAFEIDADLYMLSYGSGQSQLWFDGYTGQDTVLFDDFYGGAIKYGFLLKLLDGYKFDLPVKGGFTRKLWKRVIITSNADPESWYPTGLTPALRRRIKAITHFVDGPQ